MSNKVRAASVLCLSTLMLGLVACSNNNNAPASENNAASGMLQIQVQQVRGHWRRSVSLAL